MKKPPAKNNDEPTLSLNPPEAFVLFHFLNRLDEKHSHLFSHPAEEHVIWRLIDQLEKNIPNYGKNYDKHLAAARETVRSQSEE